MHLPLRHFLARTLSFYSLLFHMSRHLRQQRHCKQMRTLFCRRVNAMWRVTIEEATWSVLMVESSRGLWPRTLEVFSTEYDLNIAFCLVPTPPARSGAPLGASISTCRWPERGTRSKQANVVAINCFVAVEVGQKITARTPPISRTQGTRLERNATDYSTRALAEIGAQLYPSQISVMQSVLCCTNQQPLCSCDPCTPARPHQTKRSHSVAHHLKSDASVRDLCLLLHINLPRPPLDFFSRLVPCGIHPAPTINQRSLDLPLCHQTKRVIYPSFDTPFPAGLFTSFHCRVLCGRFD